MQKPSHFMYLFPSFLLLLALIFCWIYSRAVGVCFSASPGSPFRRRPLGRAQPAPPGPGRGSPAVVNRPGALQGHGAPRPALGSPARPQPSVFIWALRSALLSAFLNMCGKDSASLGPLPRFRLGAPRPAPEAGRSSGCALAGRPERPAEDSRLRTRRSGGLWVKWMRDHFQGPPQAAFGKGTLFPCLFYFHLQFSLCSHFQLTKTRAKHFLYFNLYLFF